MAIYHLSAKVIGRAAGRSSVAAAAYRSGERLRDERQDVEHDYTRKGGVVHAEIMAPANAPAWMRDRTRLWNAVEAVERRRDSQLAREIEVALPRELSPPERLELVRGFVERQFVARGMIADVAVHERAARDGQSQPHAHMMLTMRELTGAGFGKKERSWNAPEVLVGWREAWAREANVALERAGRGERVDHRTLEAQRLEAAQRAEVAREVGRPELALVHERQAVALDREPEPKLGPAASALERRGIETERGTARREVEARNHERQGAGERQLALRMELAERGRAFIAAARERLDGLWSRAEAAMGRARARNPGTREADQPERGPGLWTRLAGMLGRKSPEPERSSTATSREWISPEEQAYRAQRDAILGRPSPDPDRSVGEPGHERAAFDEQAYRAQRDAILGRKPPEPADRSAGEPNRERAAFDEQAYRAQRDAILGRPSPDPDRSVGTTGHEPIAPVRGLDQAQRDATLGRHQSDDRDAQADQGKDRDRGPGRDRDRGR